MYFTGAKKKNEAAITWLKKNNAKKDTFSYFFKISFCISSVFFSAKMIRTAETTIQCLLHSFYPKNFLLIFGYCGAEQGLFIYFASFVV